MSCIVRKITSTVSAKPPFELQDISFALKDGQIIAILGQSGAGKTSLLNALAGFLPVQRGAVILDDKTVSCSTYCLPPLDRNMGIIFQDHNLLPHLSLLENLTLGMEKQDVYRRKTEIQIMLEELQLTHLQKTLPHQVSGGQQQRVALGRALIHNKKLLLFDEPFSGLDQGRMVQLARTIRNSVQKYNRIAVLVTHHIEEAFLIADMIGIMKDGKLLEVSTPHIIYHTPSTLEIAEYVGPIHILAGEKESSTKVKTNFGSAGIPGRLPSSTKHIQLLTRPDDYTLIKGKQFAVQAISFLGMSQLVTVSNRTTTLQVSLEHHKSLCVGDMVDVKLSNKHPYVAYDMRGRKIH